MLRSYCPPRRCQCPMKTKQDTYVPRSLAPQNISSSAYGDTLRYEHIRCPSNRAHCEQRGNFLSQSRSSISQGIHFLLWTSSGLPSLCGGSGGGGGLPGGLRPFLRRHPRFPGRAEEELVVFITPLCLVSLAFLAALALALRLPAAPFSRFCSFCNSTAAYSRKRLAVSTRISLAGRKRDHLARRFRGLPVAGRSKELYFFRSRASPVLPVGMQKSTTFFSSPSL